MNFHKEKSNLHHAIIVLPSHRIMQASIDQLKIMTPQRRTNTRKDKHKEET